MEPVGFRLRALEPEDVDCMYRWENTPGMWRHGCSPAPLSRHLIWEYVNNYEADPFVAGQLRLIVESDGVAVGAVDLYDVDRLNRRAMVGVMIEEGSRRRGLGRRALAELSAYCADVLGLHQLGAIVEAGNAPSHRLFAGSGFVECGMLAQWFRRGREFADAVMYQRLL